MSDDLISRKELLEELENFTMRITGSANSMAITIVDECKKSFKRMADEQPVAYDSDKVVEKIEDIMQDESVRFCDQAVNRAVNIVKSGGIDK